MEKLYQAFNLCFSSDIAIPEFRVETSEGKIPDVTIKACLLPDQREANPQQLLLDIPSVGRFFISHGNTIHYESHSSTHVDELRLFLLGSCMGALLQQRGLIVLHGNAISLDGETCTLFVGHSGVGKSTLAARHVKQNNQILADDVSAIFFDADSNPWVIPSYPQIKLWQDSADLLSINTNQLRRVRPADAKFALPIHDQFCLKPLRLTNIVELTRQENTFELTGLQKFHRLIEHSYRYHFLTLMKLNESYAKRLMQLAGKVEMRTQHAHKH